MAKRYFLLFFIAVFTLGIQAQSMDTPTGRWKTTDDETGETKSIIEIYEEGNAYAGRVAQILTGNDDALCEKCSGKQKNKPMLGLIIINDLKPEGKGEWSGGTILDPQKGSEYRLSAWFEDGDANKLYIRGKHWTGLYRTQVWTRE